MTGNQSELMVKPVEQEKELQEGITRERKKLNLLKHKRYVVNRNIEDALRIERDIEDEVH